MGPLVKRVAQLGFRMKSTQIKSVLSNRRPYSSEDVSSSSKKPAACLFDTLGVVESLKAQGFTSKQAEAITMALANALEKASETFVSETEVQEATGLQEAHLSELRCEMKGLEDKNLSMLHKERMKLQTDFELKTENLAAEIAKMCGELLTTHTAAATELTNKYDRSDLEQKSERLRLDMEKQHAESAAAIDASYKKLDRDMQALYARLEASYAMRISGIQKLSAKMEGMKNELTKLCVGLLVVSTGAVVVGVISVMPSATGKKP